MYARTARACAFLLAFALAGCEMQLDDIGELEQPSYLLMLLNGSNRSIPGDGERVGRHTISAARFTATDELRTDVIVAYERDVAGDRVGWWRQSTDAAYSSSSWPAPKESPSNGGTFTYYDGTPWVVAADTPGLVVMVTTTGSTLGAESDVAALVSTDNGNTFINPHLLTKQWRMSAKPGITDLSVASVTNGGDNTVWATWIRREYLSEGVYVPRRMVTRFHYNGSSLVVDLAEQPFADSKGAQPGVLAVDRYLGHEIVYWVTARGAPLDEELPCSTGTIPVEWQLAVGNYDNGIFGWDTAEYIHADPEWPVCVANGTMHHRARPAVAVDADGGLNVVFTRSSPTGAMVSLRRRDPKGGGLTGEEWPPKAVHDQWGGVVARAGRKMGVSFRTTEDDPNGQNLMVSIRAVSSFDGESWDAQSGTISWIDGFKGEKAVWKVPASGWGKWDAAVGTETSNVVGLFWADHREGGVPRIYYENLHIQDY